jgi:hypothetical protein
MPANLTEIQPGTAPLGRIWNKSNTRAPANATIRSKFHSQSHADVSSRTEIQRIPGKIAAFIFPPGILFSTPLRLKRL